MIKNIVIGILAVLCLLLSVYSVIQKTTADKFQKEVVLQSERAESSAMLARAAAEEAKKQRMSAEAIAKEIHRQLLSTEQRLLECTQKARKRR